MLLDSASCIFNCSMNFDLLFNKLRWGSVRIIPGAAFFSLQFWLLAVFVFDLFDLSSKIETFCDFEKKFRKIKFNFFFKIWILQTCSWWPTNYSENLQNEYQNLFWLRISIYYFSCDFSTHFKKFSLFYPKVWERIWESCVKMRLFNWA